MIFIPTIVAYSLLKCLKLKKVSPMVTLSKILLLSLLLASPKLYLTTELVLRFPRFTEERSGYTIASFLYFLLSKKQNYHLDMDMKNFSYGIDENSLYVGFSALVLFLIGLLSFKKQKIVFFLLLFNFWLMLGDNISLSLWEILRKLPFFSFFRVAQRFRFSFFLFFSLFVGIGFERFLNALNKRYRILLAGAVIMLIFFDLYLFSDRNFLSKSFIIKYPQSIKKSSSFSSIKSFAVDYAYDANSDLPSKLRYHPAYLP